MNEFEVSWEDGTTWDIAWFRDAGGYFAQRWFPDGDDEGADGPFIETPGPEVVTVENLEVLEEVMGRSLPGPVREQLELEAHRDPFTDEMRTAWTVESAFAITRLHPDLGWIETFAPPGHPQPLGDQWLPEHVAWCLDKLDGVELASGLGDSNG